MNSKETIIDDLIAGFIAAENGRVAQSDQNSRVLYRNKKIANKVGIVSGGGSGHEPLFLGLLGENLVDAVAIGNIFAAPTPGTVCEAIKQADQGAGVVCLFGNYAGDVLNFDMGVDLAAMEDILAINIPISDDVASAPKELKAERRGIAGDLFVIKEVAAAAAKGYSLEECVRIGKEANEKIFSIGVGIASGTNPMNGKKNFDLAEDEIEFGLGIHGEPGIEKMKIVGAEELTNRMYDVVKQEVEETGEKEVIICINGLGSTTCLELYIVNNEVNKRLISEGYTIHDTLIGSVCTTQEMAGFSITIQAVTSELKELYDLDAYSSCYFHKEDY
nr:dihydroxyacetone kinase subunit DhaK [Enterococcus sp. MJM16]